MMFKSTKTCKPATITKIKRNLPITVRIAKRPPYKSLSLIPKWSALFKSIVKVDVNVGSPQLVPSHTLTD